MNGRMKRAAQRADGEAAAAARMGILCGLEAPAEVAERPVGWMVSVSGSVKGAGHTCRVCAPVRPGAMLPVYRSQLAATLPCVRCGQVLEQQATPTCQECGERWLSPVQRACSCDAPGVRL